MSDAAARARVLDPTASFIVRAPAGSGKTELLIQRYLRLLARVEAPESIVAITFTRKAAAEMRARVLDALRAARGPCPREPHKALTWELARAALETGDRAGWGLIENPARVRMQTVDSLCASIARQMPLVSGFGAMPEIVEKAGPLYAEAARMTLLAADEPDAVASLLLHLDNNFSRTRDLIAGMLEKRDQWLRHVGVGAPLAQVRRQVELCLAEIISETLAPARTAALAAGLRDVPGTSIDDAPRWKELSGELLTDSGTWRKRSAAAQRLEGNDDLRQKLYAAGKLPPARFPDTQWEALEAIVRVLPLAVGNLRYVFRERGCTDFVELTLASLRALGDESAPSDLALALGYRLQHILLDEFQDTSYSQMALLERLTRAWEPGDGRTLFLVGDPMQSIYRFRQAEVGLFLKSWDEGIGQVRLEPLTLSVNFRSGAHLVDWVNETFERAFPVHEDAAKGAVSYTRCESGTGALAAEVHIHGFIGDEARFQEAERVRMLAGDARLRGSIAILVRARTHLPAIIAELRRSAIPYEAIEIAELGQRAIVQDLMALTFALLHPADRISWLAILRAPWCGLPLADLHAIAAPDRVQPLWDLVRRPDLAVSPDAAERLSRVVPVLEQALSEKGRRALREWIEHTWIRLGGPACVPDASDLENAAAYFELLESMAEGGDLPDFSLFRDQVAGLFAQTDAGGDRAVQIMTIHKAKGLEFDTVIVPGLGAPPKNEDSTLMLWHEPAEDRVLFAPISESGTKDEIYKFLGGIEREKSRYEAVRLLYVAVTRARTQLHLTGCAKLKEDGSASAPSGSFLNILWPAVEQHFVAQPPAPAPAPEPVARVIRRLPAGWQLPAPPPAVRWARAEIESGEPHVVAYEWVGDTLRHVGTVVHAYLQRITREGLVGWDQQRIASQAGTFRSLLANLGIPDAEMSGAVDRVQKAVTRTLSDPRGRWILGEHSEDDCEVSLSGVSEGRIHTAVIDRTFIDEAGVRWIIDYKTSAHEGGSVEAFLANEKRRYQEQLERYAQLFAQQDHRAVRLGLYFPLIASGWIEWEAPRVMERQASLFGD